LSFPLPSAVLSFISLPLLPDILCFSGWYRSDVDFRRIVSFVSMLPINRSRAGCLHRSTCLCNVTGGEPIRCRITYPDVISFMFSLLRVLCSWQECGFLPYPSVAEFISFTVTLSYELAVVGCIASLRTIRLASLISANMLPFHRQTCKVYIQFWTPTFRRDRSRQYPMKVWVLFSLMISFPPTNIVIQILTSWCVSSFMDSMCGCLLSNFCRYLHVYLAQKKRVSQKNNKKKKISSCRIPCWLIYNQDWAPSLL